ncbi:efflux RND transporter periplasmic adaptor subunit [Chakrabartyella piscis]|uniref:efflux RND transporter periplasmic adaptor subunit n=1 Tax=Chakrabartyella piscis TaxID=2918914 RepID=UPI002958C075|nr:efflux RND transporter periplasmic adaptor subunit [Chakrabartyella piscis]
MKKKLILGGICVAIIAVVAFRIYSSTSGGSGDAMMAGGPPSGMSGGMGGGASSSSRAVEAMTIGTDEISSTFLYSGTAAPSSQVSIMAAGSAEVTAVYAEVGDTVTKGQVLFTLDTTDLYNSLKTTQASYEVSQLACDNAELTYQNNLILYTEGAISKTEMDQYEYQYKSAAANLNSLQVQLSVLNSSIADYSVKSTINGVITDRNIEVGATASMSSAAFTVMDLSTIKIEVGVSEQAINTIQIGDGAEVTITSLSYEPFIGEVVTASSGTNSSGTYDVIIALDNADAKIKSGMLASVSLIKEYVTETIVIPTSAIVTKDSVDCVFVLDGITAVQTPIVAGVESGEYSEIVSGLSIGDVMVNVGQSYLSDGETVNLLSLDGEDVEAPEMEMPLEGEMPEGMPEGEMPEGGAPEGAAPEAEKGE